MTAKVDVLDDQGNKRFTIKKGSLHDWGLSEAAMYCDAKLARPANKEAEKHYNNWQAMTDEQKVRYLKPNLEIRVTDSGKGAEVIRK